MFSFGPWKSVDNSNIELKSACVQVHWSRLVLGVEVRRKQIVFQGCNHCRKSLETVGLAIGTRISGKNTSYRFELWCNTHEQVVIYTWQMVKTLRDKRVYHVFPRYSDNDRRKRENWKKWKKKSIITHWWNPVWIFFFYSRVLIPPKRTEIFIFFLTRISLILGTR